MTSKGGGFQLWGTPSQPSSSLFAWFSPDFRELKPLVPSWPPRGRVGQLGPKEDS